MSLILGVDPGSRLCGYAVVEALAPGQIRYVECGVLAAKATEAAEVRLGEIARGLTEVVGELGPTCVALEEVFSAKNPKSALALAQARGMVLAVAGMAGLVVHSYPATVVKKAVTGHGRAPKEQVARMVQVLAGLNSPPQADAADALAIAITHAQRVG